MNYLCSIALGVLLPVGAMFSLQVHVEPDQNNVTASRLAGSWVSDSAVATRMGLPEVRESFEFKEDSSFLKSLPESVSDKLQQERIFECGIMVSRKDGRFVSSAPYLLTSRSGNPHLLLLREQNGVPLGGVESANVFVAPGRERHQDLLFIGGEYSTEPFRPFRRSRGDDDLSNN